jgi:L-threonylcarbamoyladenylate synthase
VSEITILEERLRPFGLWYNLMMILSSEEQAIASLLAGGVGVLPTDTVYGLVACAADPQAVGRMYAIKRRQYKPGTVIAASVEQLINLGVQRAHLAIAERWWPGSISIEIPVGPELAYLHQHTGRQGFRVVADENVRQVLQRTGPLVTSSANQPGEPPAVKVEEAYQFFKDAVGFYVDAGDRSDREPSTIARITSNGLEIIRHGAVKISPQELANSTAGNPFSGKGRTGLLATRDAE